MKKLILLLIIASPIFCKEYLLIKKVEGVFYLDSGGRSPQIATVYQKKLDKVAGKRSLSFMNLKTFPGILTYLNHLEWKIIKVYENGNVLLEKEDTVMEKEKK